MLGTENLANRMTHHFSMPLVECIAHLNQSRVSWSSPQGKKVRIDAGQGEAQKGSAERLAPLNGDGRTGKSVTRLVPVTTN